MGKWNYISSLRKLFGRYFSVWQYNYLSKASKQKAGLQVMQKDWEQTHQQQLNNEKTGGKSWSSPHMFFNYLLVWYLKWELSILNWEMITVCFKTRKGFLHFWSNTGECLFPCKNHATTFKDSFPSICYSLLIANMATKTLSNVIMLHF